MVTVSDRGQRDRCPNKKSEFGFHTFSPISRWRLFLTEALIRRLDKHCCGPRTGCCAIPAVVIFCQTCSLDLLKRLAFPDSVPDTVANDRDHIPILEHVGFITDAAMTGNNRRSAFLFFFWNADI